jgi:hypothetical protein
VIGGYAQWRRRQMGREAGRRCCLGHLPTASTWLRIQLLLRSMRGTQWDAKTWPTMLTFQRATLAGEANARKQARLNGGGGPRRAPARIATTTYQRLEARLWLFESGIAKIIVMVLVGPSAYQYCTCRDERRRFFWNHLACSPAAGPSCIRLVGVPECQRVQVWPISCGKGMLSN